MCQETLELHYGKHHNAYVTALNSLLEKNEYLRAQPLEPIIGVSAANTELAPIFNNAGQHWNHSFFWESLSPNGGTIPGNLERKLEDFGSVEQFKASFKAAALGQFGSGWTWLILAKEGKLRVTKTPNAGSPLTTGEGKALLVLDVWEHAYYLDFRNRRLDFTDNFLDKLANYESAAARLRSS